MNSGVAPSLGRFGAPIMFALFCANQVKHLVKDQRILDALADYEDTGHLSQEGLSKVGVQITASSAPSYERAASWAVIRACQGHAEQAASWALTAIAEAHPGTPEEKGKAANKAREAQKIKLEELACKSQNSTPLTKSRS